jgi:hypothetical protein
VTGAKGRGPEPAPLVGRYCLLAWLANRYRFRFVADRGGPTMFAQIGVMRPLNRDAERVFDPTRKEKHWRQRELARDR